MATEFEMEQLIILALILFLVVKGTLNKKEKKIKPISLAIIPLLLIYLTITSFKNISYINLGECIAIFVALTIGGLFGLYRSKFYSYRVNENGELLSRRHIADAIILIVYIIAKVLIITFFKHFNYISFDIINSILLVVAASSISVRRIIVAIKYINLTGKKAVI